WRGDDAWRDSGTKTRSSLIWFRGRCWTDRIRRIAKQSYRMHSARGERGRKSFASLLGTGSRCDVLAALDTVDCILAHPVFGALRRQSGEAGAPGEPAFDAELLGRACRLRIVETADGDADLAAPQTVVGERRSASPAKAPLDDVRARIGRRASPRPLQGVVPDPR